MENKQIYNDVLSVTDTSFNALSLKIFKFQSKNNPVYNKYLRSLSINLEKISHHSEIPFIPISFFRDMEIKTGNYVPERTFLSSGTTSSTRSRHFIADEQWYHNVAEEGFRQFYGPPEEYVILALLPGYTENPDSSLISMIRYFISRSGCSASGFTDIDSFPDMLNRAKQHHKKILIIGVSFALLDLAERQSPDLSGCILMETGGMKGRRKELTRKELHSYFKKNFNLDTVHSEYGMTELLSQAYSSGKGVFRCPPWLRVLTREVNDPFSGPAKGNTGVLKIVDLANISSCSFIETEDLGKVHQDGSFEVMGRLDNTILRGCNLMYI